MQHGGEERLLIAKAEDTVKLSEKHCCLKNTDFLTPSEAMIIKNSVVRGFESRQEFFGGYPDAERVMFISYPDFLDGYNTDDFLCALVITGRDIATLSHRDYLGSILGLGIKREKIGDILVAEDETIVYADSEIAGYIKDNLTKIGRVGIHIERKEIKEIRVPEKKTVKISGTVQSVRFDAVLSTALKMSRNKAVQLIEGEKAFLNWSVCTASARNMNEGDVFSVRGFGRFKLESVTGLTKKGRICIEILKYI